MLIAIFSLLLISVVAIALVVSTGTDSALAGNFRSAGGAYYASLAGLEEARGRLLWKNPNFINQGNAFSFLFDSSGVLPNWGLTQVLYILNPAPGETVNPTGSNPAQYADTEYSQEFTWGLGGANVYTIASVSPVSSASLSGPSYKWVRINAVTQQALQLDVNGTGSGTSDAVDMLYYDAAHLNGSNQPAPSLVVGPPPSQSDWVQALEITALAVLPNGSTRLLQYVVAPLVISPDVMDLNFSGALTLDNGQFGNTSSIAFTVPSGYQINGVDGCSSPTPPSLPNAVASIAYTSSAVQPYLWSQTNPNKSNYPGAPLISPPPPPYTTTTPSLLNITATSPALLRQSWLTPASLDAVMQDIVNNADVILGSTGTYFTGSAPTFTGADLWSAAPALPWNPMTIVVNGDLTLNGLGVGNPTGNGLLLVTGTLNYHPSATWNGIILVVGQGNLVLGGHSESGGINGSVFVAQTRNSSGALLPNLAASFTDGGGPPGAGIGYNSCVVRSASGPITYKVISYHEIPTS
jgi:hypothetical protein